MIAIKVLCTGALLGLLLFATGPRFTTLSQYVKHGGVHSIVLLTNQPITVENLSNLYRQYSDGDFMISQIQIFPDKQMAVDLLSGKIATDRDESGWRQQYLAHRAHGRNPNMGEIIQIRTNAVARTIQNYKLDQKILSGTNPLLCEKNGDSCEVIWVSIGRIPPGRHGEGERRFDVYVVVGRLPSLRESETIYETLRKEFRSRQLVVSIRTTSWFIDDLSFPVVYPFLSSDPGSNPPVGSGSDEILCFTSASGVRCL